MAKFVFALESLKRHRNQRLLVAKKEMSFVEGRLQDLHLELRRALEIRSGLLSSELMIGQYAGAASYKMQVVEREIANAEEELARHKSWVLHLGKELRVVEKLEEKKKAAFESALKLQEKRAEDDWVTMSWGRNQNSFDAASESEVEV